MLILKKFSLDFSKGPVLCKRAYDLDVGLKTFIKKEKNNLFFPEHSGKNLGDIYPFVGCFFADKDDTFINKAINVYDHLDQRYQYWFGDQIALREAASTNQHVAISESIVACDPLKYLEDKSPSAIFHFKGKKLKPLMKEMFSEHFTSKNISIPISYRSNPEKPGYEIARTFNPYFKEYLAGSSYSDVKHVDATSLDFGIRSDIICKIMYLLSEKLKLLPKSIGKNAYLKSISSLNGGISSDSPEKTSLELYVASFNQLFAEISISKIFDSSKSIVPTSSDGIPIDGAHRVSIAIALDVNLPIIDIPVKNVPEIPLASYRAGLA